MIFGVLILRKFDINIFYICPPLPVYCSHCTFGNPKKVIFQQYYNDLRRKQTVTPLPTTRKNVTALPCKMKKNISDWR